MLARAVVVVLALTSYLTGPAALYTAAEAYVEIDADGSEGACDGDSLWSELEMILESAGVRTVNREWLAGRVRRPGTTASGTMARPINPVRDGHESGLDGLERWLRLARSRYGGELPA